VTPEDYEKNTRKSFKHDLFWANLDRLALFNLNFYLTFTNPDRRHFSEFCEKLAQRYGKQVLDDSFIIDLIDYDAAPFVDIVPAHQTR